MTPDILNAKVLAWNGIVNLTTEVVITKTAPHLDEALDNDEQKLRMGFALGALAAIITRWGAERLSDGA